MYSNYVDQFKTKCYVCGNLSNQMALAANVISLRCRISSLVCRLYICAIKWC